jgi:hypothetical protein
MADRDFWKGVAIGAGFGVLGWLAVVGLTVLFVWLLR